MSKERTKSLLCGLEFPNIYQQQQEVSTKGDFVSNLGKSYSILKYIFLLDIRKIKVVEHKILNDLFKNKNLS